MSVLRILNLGHRSPIQRSKHDRSLFPLSHSLFCANPLGFQVFACRPSHHSIPSLSRSVFLQVNPWSLWLIEPAILPPFFHLGPSVFCFNCSWVPAFLQLGPCHTVFHLIKPFLEFLFLINSYLLCFKSDLRVLGCVGIVSTSPTHSCLCFRILSLFYVLFFL